MKESEWEKKNLIGTSVCFQWGKILALMLKRVVIKQDQVHHSGELWDHLLLQCEFACELWGYVFSLFGEHWAMLCRVMDLQVGW